MVEVQLTLLLYIHSLQYIVQYIDIAVETQNRLRCSIHNSANKCNIPQQFLYTANINSVSFSSSPSAI